MLIALPGDRQLRPQLVLKLGGFRACLLNHLKTKINDVVRFLGFCSL